MTNNDAEVTDVSNIVNELLQRSTEESIDEDKYVKLFIESVCWTGTWVFYVSLDTKISQIKMMALSELDYERYEMRSSLYSLIYPDGQRILNEHKTVAEENLQDDVELELIRVPPTQEVMLRFAQHITESSIRLATAQLPAAPQKKPICNVCLDIQPPEFMSDVRKIMVTLIEYSLHLMSLKPNARYIFDIVRRKLMSENFYVNESQMRPYLNSGCSERRIKFVINASFNDPFSVNEWLAEVKGVDSEILGLPRTFRVDDSKTVDEELQELLVLFKLYLRASFKLCPKATTALTEMGFEFNDICRALRFTGNNLPEAVEYMIGHKEATRDGARPGLDCGLSPTSDMYKAIVSEPAIVLPMADPTVLYSCLSIMDANSFLVSSMRFPTMMNLLNKILATYYLTRCNLAMEQMVGKIPND